MNNKPLTAADLSTIQTGTYLRRIICQSIIDRRLAELDTSPAARLERLLIYWRRHNQVTPWYLHLDATSFPELWK